jgi:DNA-binding transcriptional MerR regulator
MYRRTGHIERPDLERYADHPLFNTKAVVQQTGVPAPTLRAWESRYAILAPERAGNAYRLYSERDIALIRWLKERVDSGMAISQAVALWRHLEEEYQKARRLQQAEEALPAGRRPAFHVALSASTPLPATTPLAAAPSAGAGQAEALAGKQKLPSGGLSALSPLSPLVTAGPDSPLLGGSQPALYNVDVVREELIEAFKCLDDTRAQRLLASLLALYSVEQVCAEVVTPLLWQVGQLWELGQLNVAVEHFASNFLRGFLTNLLYISTSANEGPPVICCCAPGEPHELAPLMLALLLRRLGVRTIYLGQSIEIGGLLEVVRFLQPTGLCISVTMPAYVATLIDLARQLQELPEPHPLLVFGGQAFLYHADLANHVPGGLYLSGPLPEILEELRRLLAERTTDRASPGGGASPDGPWLPPAPPRP